jgi:hypothetical protein
MDLVTALSRLRARSWKARLAISGPLADHGIKSVPPSDSDLRKAGVPEGYLKSMDRTCLVARSMSVVGIY